MEWSLDDIGIQYGQLTSESSGRAARGNETSDLAAAKQGGSETLNRVAGEQASARLLSFAQW